MGIVSWVKTNVIAPAWNESIDVRGSLDKAGAKDRIRVGLRANPEMREAYRDHAEERSITADLNAFDKKCRSERDVFEQVEDGQDPQLQIPGVEDVRNDRVTFTFGGEKLDKSTWLLEEHELEAVLEDYTRRIDGLTHGRAFYAALLVALRHGGGVRVRDIYEP